MSSIISHCQIAVSSLLVDFWCTYQLVFSLVKLRHIIVELSLWSQTTTVRVGDIVVGTTWWRNPPIRLWALGSNQQELHKKLVAYREINLLQSSIGKRWSHVNQFTNMKKYNKEQCNFAITWVRPKHNYWRSVKHILRSQYPLKLLISQSLKIKLLQYIFMHQIGKPQKGKKIPSLAWSWSYKPFHATHPETLIPFLFSLA